MESLKLDGIWSQPGGDKKVFNAEDCLISWRKNNKLLFIEGKREIQVKKEICECLFGEPTEVRVHSSDSSDISAVIEDLKAGQLVNGEAIQALSQSIIHINAVLKQVQVSKDKSVEFLNEVKSYNSAETINCYDKNANQAHVCESPEVELCKSVVLEQTATPVEDNRNNNSTNVILHLLVSPFSKVDEREVIQQRSVYHHLLPRCWKMRIFGRNLSNANRGGKNRRNTKLTYKFDSCENYKP